jgi:hypothetical protein
MSIYPGSIFSPVPYSIVGERTKDMTVAVSVPYPGVVILSQSMTERIVGMYPQYTYRLVGCRESNFVQIAPSLLSGLKVVGQLELVDGYYLDTTTKMKRRDLLFALKKLADEMRLACFASCATGFSFLADDVLDGILNMGGIKRKVVKRLSFDEVMAREYADI